MLIFLNSIVPYFPIIVLIMIQVMFLFLPVFLRNWDDDLINALTYTAIQGITAGFIFIVLPSLFDIFSLNILQTIIVLVGVMFLALFQTMRMIPFELTYPIYPQKKPQEDLSFSEFYTSQHLTALARYSTIDDPVASVRYMKLKERLLRYKPTEKKRL